MRFWLTVVALTLAPWALPQTQLRYLDFGQGQAQCMTVDTNGNTYVAGTELRASPDATQGFVSDIVIRKLDSNFVDKQGDLFVGGSTFAVDYPLAHPVVGDRKSRAVPIAVQ